MGGEEGKRGVCLSCCAYMLHNTDISGNADPDRVQMSHCFTVDVAWTRAAMATNTLQGGNALMFFVDGDDDEEEEEVCEGRSRQRKGRETWLVSRRARPLRQGDSSD